MLNNLNVPENRLAMAAIVNENMTAGPATLWATIPATRRS